MSTKSLISKIENLSTTLSAKQLTTFLDIMDDMAKMVEKAKSTPENTKTNQQTYEISANSLLH